MNPFIIPFAVVEVLSLGRLIIGLTYVLLLSHAMFVCVDSLVFVIPLTATSRILLVAHQWLFIDLSKVPQCGIFLSILSLTNAKSSLFRMLSSFHHPQSNLYLMSDDGGAGGAVICCFFLLVLHNFIRNKLAPPIFFKTLLFRNFLHGMLSHHNPT